MFCYNDVLRLFCFSVSVNISGEISADHIHFPTYCTVLCFSFWCVSAWSCGTSWWNRKIICSAKYSLSRSSTGLCTAPIFGQVGLHICEELRKHTFSSSLLHLIQYWNEMRLVFKHWCLHGCGSFCISGLIPLCLALTNRDDLLRLRPGIFMTLGWGWVSTT